MKLQRLICFMLIVIAGETQVSAQYLTKRLASLAQQTGVSVEKGMLEKSTSIDSVFMFRGKPLHVCTNEYGEISHIGYSLFSKPVRTVQPSVVYNFLERYLLELDLLTPAERKERLWHDGLITEGDLLKFLNQSAEKEQISISFQTNHKYIVDWQRGNVHQRIGFSVDPELLIGADLTELEDIFARHLKYLASQKVIIADSLSDNDNYICDVVIDHYKYRKSKLRCHRSDVIQLIQSDCNNVSLRKMSEDEDVLFALNSEMGFMHLVRFEEMRAKIFPFVSIYNTPDSFIDMLMGEKEKTR